MIYRPAPASLAEMRGSTPLSDVDRTRVRYLSKRELFSEPSYRLPKAAVAGYVRSNSYGLRATNSYSTLIRMPPGQMTPLHDYSAEHIIFVLSGQIDFLIGPDVYELNQYDEIFIPAHVFYIYRNPGDVEAAFFNVVSRLDEWPATGQYPDVDTA
jgi:quercetin dioxygenase-like cupin family protein